MPLPPTSHGVVDTAKTRYAGSTKIYIDGHRSGAPSPSALFSRSLAWRRRFEVADWIDVAHWIEVSDWTNIAEPTHWSLTNQIRSNARRVSLRSVRPTCVCARRFRTGLGEGSVLAKLGGSSTDYCGSGVGGSGARRRSAANKQPSSQLHESGSARRLFSTKKKPRNWNVGSGISGYRRT